jgi:hypothetical protein
MKKNGKNVTLSFCHSGVGSLIIYLGEKNLKNIYIIYKKYL